MLVVQDDIEARIRSVLAQHGRLSIDVASYGVGADLYAGGMTSHATVNVMLALEEAFELEFPDALLDRRVFACIAAIRDALGSIRQTTEGS